MFFNFFQGGFALESDKERAYPRDADVPGELWDVPHPGLVLEGVYAKTAETRLALLRMGIL